MSYARGYVSSNKKCGIAPKTFSPAHFPITFARARPGTLYRAYPFFSPFFDALVRSTRATTKITMRNTKGKREEGLVSRFPSSSTDKKKKKEKKNALRNKSYQDPVKPTSGKWILIQGILIRGIQRRIRVGIFASRNRVGFVPTTLNISFPTLAVR